MARSMTTATSLALAAALAAVAAPAHAQHAEPFRTRNLSPLVSIFGIPSWRADVAGRGLVVTSELANHYEFSRRGDDVLILDGETWRNGIEVRRQVGRRWFVAAETAYYVLSGGVLDGVIDGWHSLLGLPDGGRDDRPEGDLVFQAADLGGVFYHLDRGTRGWGDLKLAAGRSLGAHGRFVLTGTVKLPTGEERMLAGSGSSDWSVTLLRQAGAELRGRPAGGYWGLGVVAPGRAERIAFEQHDLVPVAVVGGGWRVLPRIGVRAQLDVHAAFYDTRLEALGQTSVQATLGGWAELGERMRVEFGVNEDLHVSTSPDVVIHGSVHWRW